MVVLATVIGCAGGTGGERAADRAGRRRVPIRRRNLKGRKIILDGVTVV